MARQAKLEKIAPTILPDDFDHWDEEEVPPTVLPKDFDGFDEAPAPRGRSSAPQAAVAAPTLINVPEKAARQASVTPQVHTMPAPAHIAAPKSTQEFPKMRKPAAVPKRSGSISLNLREAAAEAPAALAQPSEYVTTEELSSLVQEYDATLDEESDTEKQRKKSLMIKWIGAIVLVLAIVAAVFILTLHKPAQQSPSVVVVHNPVVTITPDATPLKPVKEKPSPAKPAQSTTATSAPAQQP